MKIYIAMWVKDFPRSKSFCLTQKIQRNIMMVSSCISNSAHDKAPSMAGEGGGHRTPSLLSALKGPQAELIDAWLCNNFKPGWDVCRLCCKHNQMVFTF